jgi:hypothetical protein
MRTSRVARSMVMPPASDTGTLVRASTSDDPAATSARVGSAVGGTLRTRPSAQAADAHVPTMTHHLMMRGPIDRATNHARTGNEKGPAEQSSRRALPGAWYPRTVESDWVIESEP